MASSYPGALDSFTNPTSTDAMDASAALYHDVQHAGVNDAIEAVQAELGTDPAGAQATVKARLEKVETLRGPGPIIWQSSRYVLNALTRAATTTTQSLNGDVQVYVPWWCPAAATLDRIAVEVTTGQTGANARLGVYSSTSTGAPGDLLLDGGEVDCATTGVKELTVSQALTAGTLYWLALLNETSAVVYKCLPLATAWQAIDVANTTTIQSCLFSDSAATYTSGLPATAPALSSLASPSYAGIAFWLRRS